jgi:hypothetical protein
MDAKFRIAAEAAAGAELLIDAKAVAGRICDAASAALVGAGRRAQLDQAGRADPAQNCMVGRYSPN